MNSARHHGPSNKLNKAKDVGYKFLANLSVHGVPRILRSENLAVRLVWIVLILFSASYGLFNITNSVQDFYRYHTITNVVREHAYSMEFPAITICTKDFIIFRITDATKTTPYAFFNTSLSSFVSDTFKYKSSQFNTSQDLQFFKIPKLYGNCVRFINQTNVSSDNLLDSFSLLFYLDRYEEDSQNIFIKSTLYEYFEIYVTNKNVNSFLQTSAISVETSSLSGALVKFVKAEIETKLPDPYNPCYTEVPDIQVNCIERCIVHKIAEAYNCSIPSYYEIKSLNRCVNYPGAYLRTDINDIPYEQYYNKIHVLTQEFNAACSEMCPKECTFVKYDLTVTYQGLQSYTFKFDFSFQDFSSLVITQIPKFTSFSLLSSIGGSFGLFIGVRFLSLVEILELFIDLFCVLYF